MKRSVWGSLAVLLWVCAMGKADTVTFKNGDKLTGTFVKVTGGNLALKSDMMGDVTIPLAKVQTFVISTPAVIVGADRKLFRGQIALQESGDWQVTTNGTPQTVSAKEANVIMTADAYHAAVEAPAKIWQDWQGDATFGYAISHGDQQTHTLSATVAATRERSTDLLFRPHFRTNYGLTMLFSKAQQDGSSVTSNTISTNLRQDYLFSPANFVFVLGQLDHVDAQGLYLQQTFGGGFGRDFVHTSKTTFSVLGGVDYLHQRFENLTTVVSVQALAGEKLGMQITKGLRLDHNLNFYPDLEHGGQYHFDTATSLSLKINAHFNANAGAIDLYVTNPPPGSHSNNIALTTGLGVTF